MNGEITLQRQVKVECWHVVGTMAKARKRDELRVLLMRVGEGGASDAEDIAAHLFFESRSRRTVAERMLQIAASYGLVEKEGAGDAQHRQPRGRERKAWRQQSYVLTEDGKTAVAREEVLVPEQGAWRVWCSDDPLLTSPLLSVEPWQDPSAFDEVRNNRGEGQRAFQQLPGCLTRAIGKAAAPAADDGKRVRLDKLEKKGEKVNVVATLRLVWQLTRKRLRLHGKLDGHPVDTDIRPPAIDAEEVWRQLLSGEELWRHWDTTRQSLRVAFEEASDPERTSMTRSLPFGDPHVRQFGSFEPLTIPQVPIAASSSDDAQRWAQWRLLHGIRDYATAPLFEACCKEAMVPFNEYRLSLPERSALAAEAWNARAGRPTPRVWHLVAAEDWGL